jgi:pyruvate dehydrogenase E1 component beta subunit
MPNLRAADRASAHLSRWWVDAGQRVVEGDVLAEIASGSMTMEIEAPAAGTVVELLVPAGSATLPARTRLAVIALAPIAAEAGAASAPAAAPDVLAPAPRPPEPEAAAGPATDLSFTAALQAALREEMQRDPDVFLIGESVADFGRCSGVAKGLHEEFGSHRVVGAPVTPAGFTGLAVGAAMAGLRPVVEYRGWSLALQALDHIVSTAAKTRYRSGGRLGVPLVLRGLNGAWPGTGAMHSVSFAAWFAHVPGLKVVCPASPACAKGLLKAAIRDPDPVIVLETEALYEVCGPVPDSTDWLVPLGRARIARPGRDVSIVTYGRGVLVANDAAGILQASGIEAEVVDLRSLRPLDMPAILASVRRTGRLLALDDGWPACSIAAEVCASVASTALDALKTAPVRLTGADVPTPFAPGLEAQTLPDAHQVAACVRRLVG